MSRHGSVAAEVAHILRDTKNMDAEGVKIQYGIELLDSGEVYDYTYDETFESLAEWVIFNNEQNAEDDYEDDRHGDFKDEDY